MSSAVLVLNADYQPMEVVTWQEAVGLIVGEKAHLVEAYANKFVRSPSFQMPWPAVIARVRYVLDRASVRLSRRNVLARDAYTCGYCGVRPRTKSGAPDLKQLTIDHVVPRAQADRGWVRLPWSGERARVTSWNNLLTACQDCNFSKADRTPDQAQMKMRKRPHPPSMLDIACMSLIRYKIPEEWKDYLPADSPWRDYWDGELIE